MATVISRVNRVEQVEESVDAVIATPPGAGEEPSH
jgi:hypothetical protein